MKKDNYFKRLGYTKEDIASKKFSNFNISGTCPTVDYMDIEKFLNTTSSSKEEHSVFDFSKTDREKNCHLGKAYTDEVKTKCNAGFYLKVNTGTNDDKPVNLVASFKLDETNDVLYDQNYVELPEGSKTKLLVCIDSDEKDSEHKCFRNGLTHIKVNKNAELTLIKVQNLNKVSHNFETLKIDVNENAVVNIYDIQLGSSINGASTSTYIYEGNAEVNIFPLYFVNEKRRMDLEQNLIIKGKKANAQIVANGVLKDKSKKMFRGNIFFNRGCIQSFGRFSDNTIMFDKKVVGMTIPTILCDEDDVVGEHAASFEAIDNDRLYYLMTRGFDETSAKRLIAEATFTPVINMIDDETIKNKLINELNANLDSTEII